MKGSKLIASSLAGVAHALSLRSDLPSSTDGHLHDTRAEDLSVVPWQQSEPDLARRDAQSGAACGPTAGNVSCAAGLCCSDGVSKLPVVFCSATLLILTSSCVEHMRNRHCLLWSAGLPAFLWPGLRWKPGAHGQGYIQCTPALVWECPLWC